MDYNWKNTKWVTVLNIEAYDPDQGERIVNPTFITEMMAKRAGRSERHD